MTLDECMAWNLIRCEQKRRATRPGFWAAGFSIVILVVLAMGYGPALVMGVCAIVVVEYAVMAVRMVRFRRRADRFWRTIELMRPPIALLAVSQRCTEYPDDVLWAMECSEAHLLGDCLLCGAE